MTCDLLRRVCEAAFEKQILFHVSAAECAARTLRGIILRKWLIVSTTSQISSLLCCSWSKSHRITSSRYNPPQASQEIMFEEEYYHSQTNIGVNSLTHFFKPRVIWRLVSLLAVGVYLQTVVESNSAIKNYSYSKSKQMFLAGFASGSGRTMMLIFILD